MRPAVVELDPEPVEPEPADPEPPDPQYAVPLSTAVQVVLAAVSCSIGLSTPSCAEHGIEVGEQLPLIDVLTLVDINVLEGPAGVEVDVVVGAGGDVPGA